MGCQWNNVENQNVATRCLALTEGFRHHPRVGHARAIAACGLVAGAALLCYAVAVEPSRLELTELEIRDGRLTHVLAGRQVALLSDLHFGSAAEPAAERALLAIEAARPDLILLAGDYVAWGGGPEAYRRALEYLSRLRAPLGVYGVLGDADRTSSRQSCLFCHETAGGPPTTRHRVTFLKNAATEIDLPNGRLRLVGLDPDFPVSAPERLRALLAGDTPTILLSHSSRVYQLIDASQAVLTLSGDTHGGQLRLPSWFWRLARPKPDPEHVHGYFRDGDKSLFVTRGIGTSHLRFRLGARPELVFFRFAGATR